MSGVAAPVHGNGEEPRDATTLEARDGATLETRDGDTLDARDGAALDARDVAALGAASLSILTVSKLDERRTTCGCLCSCRDSSSCSLDVWISKHRTTEYEGL